MSLLDHAPATASTSPFHFYDIEALANIFTVALLRVKPGAAPEVAVYYLLDDAETPPPGKKHALTNDRVRAMIAKAGPQLKARIIDHNPALAALARKAGIDPATVKFSLGDLSSDSVVADMIVDLGGVSDGRPGSWLGRNRKLAPVGDIAATYDPTIHPFIAGYNSFNYDTTMLSMFLHARCGGHEPAAVTAATMREHNDGLFKPEFINSMIGYLWDDDGYGDNGAAEIRKSMIDTGRHVDIARLNEVQMKVGLKKLLGMMGHQILESDKLSGPGARVEDLDELVELISYNVSDVIGTYLLFQEPTYSSTFDQRVGLLHTYPETIYPPKRDSYSEPDVKATTVRKRRLTPDTPSAQFAGTILAPYRALDEIPGHMSDNPVVSFRYPHESVAREKGLGSVNVLTATRDFFRESVTDPEALAQFKHVYDFYRRIEGRNFNGEKTDWAAKIAQLADYGLKIIHRLVENANTPPPPVDDAFIAAFDAAWPEDAARRTAEHSNSTTWHLMVIVEHIAAMLGTQTGYKIKREDISDGFTLETLEQALDLLEAIMPFFRNVHGLSKPFGDKASQGLYEDLAYAARVTRAFYRADHDRRIPFDPADQDGPILLSHPPTRDDEELHDVYRLPEIGKLPSCVPYYRADGSPSGAMANFSTGGIHGSEYDAASYAADVAERRIAEENNSLLVAAAIDEALAHLPAADGSVEEIDEEAMIASLLDWARAEIDAESGPIEHDPALDAFAGWQNDPKIAAKRAKKLASINNSRSKKALTRAKREAAKRIKAMAKKRDHALDAVAWAEGRTEPAVDEELIPEIPLPRDHWARDHGRTHFAPREVALAAAWVRFNLGIEFIGADGTLTEVRYNEVIAGGKRNQPYWRSTPRGVSSAELFSPVNSSVNVTVGESHQATKLNDSYVHTSVGEVIHEDFTSYYPLMLTNLAAFVNPDLGVDSEGRPVDRYSDIFAQKEIYGRQMKDKSIDAETRARLAILRNGTKLILNAASGAADPTSHSTNIRMNNTIVAMRVIGQLFSWRIGQAQTFAGATIVSTNTDGLYSQGLDFATNQEVLDRYAPEIGVDIEPETLHLVSKDSNNRAEYARGADGSIELLGASGTQLACATGPNPRKSLSHPAFTDYMLMEYFRRILAGETNPDTGEPLSIFDPFCRAIGEEIMESMIADMEPKKLLTFFQNIISPNTSMALYCVDHVDGQTALDADTVVGPDQPIEEGSGMRRARVLGRYNRIFLVDPVKLAACPRLGSAVNIAAAQARTITEAKRVARIRKNERRSIVEKFAHDVLVASGMDATWLSGNCDRVSRVHTGINPGQPMLIHNASIMHAPDEGLLDELINCLDLKAYLDLVDDATDGCFKSWRNTRPGDTRARAQNKPVIEDISGRG